MSSTVIDYYYFSSLTLAAMDTTSNALSRIFQTFAQHPEVQDKLHAELLDASPGGADIPYDQLVDLPYLDAVCRETLRLSVSSNSTGQLRTDEIAHRYPPVTFMSREYVTVSSTCIPADTRHNQSSSRYYHAFI